MYRQHLEKSLDIHSNVLSFFSFSINNEVGWSQNRPRISFRIILWWHSFCIVPFYLSNYYFLELLTSTFHFEMSQFLIQTNVFHTLLKFDSFEFWCNMLVNNIFFLDHEYPGFSSSLQCHCDIDRSIKKMNSDQNSTIPI